ncbi:MAG: Na/Pi cotransporter family protein [Bacteroidetes bacterium]|nr:Na/Pi cotransporter family protein [Bacteroidota bacterium]
MEALPDTSTPAIPNAKWKLIARSALYFLVGLLVFLFSLDLMISSLQQLGTVVTDTILLATSNPFTGLFIGLLVTAIIQSSSATTSLTVALVASGTLSLPGAVPIIMGANIGTTITSTIVSLSFISQKKEFRRAVSAGTYHGFFKILTAFILFPLEYNFHFLSGIAQFIAVNFFHEPVVHNATNFKLLGSSLSWPVSFISAKINNGYLLAALSVILLLGSILFFRKVISQMIGFSSQGRVQQFVFKNPYKSFGWGILTTAAIRSSTVTTSLVVPLVAKKTIKLRQAAAFILGANIGTTITAFMASTFNSNAAISIALTHFLFNFIGVLLFFRTPVLKEIPFQLALGMGRLTLKNRLVGFLYLLVVFFLLPFSLIFLSQEF